MLLREYRIRGCCQSLVGWNRVICCRIGLTLESRIAGEGWQLIGSWFCIGTLLLEQYPLIKKSPKEIAFCLEALFSLNIHLEMSKSSLCFYLMLQQTCCMHSLASKLGCYVSIHMHKYQEFIQVNLRISKVPSYWRWSPLLKSCSFSDEPPYSRTPLIRDSRVWYYQ